MIWWNKSSKKKNLQWLMLIKKMITISHLRFSDNEIKAPYLISQADFLAVHHFPLFYTMDLLKNAKDGATILINSPFKKEALWNNLPKEVQEQITQSLIDFAGNKYALLVKTNVRYSYDNGILTVDLTKLISAGLTFNKIDQQMIDNCFVLPTQGGNNND